MRSAVGSPTSPGGEGGQRPLAVGLSGAHRWLAVNGHELHACFRCMHATYVLPSM